MKAARNLHLAVAALVACAGTAAAAQDVVHTVVPGDTLYALSHRYLEDPAQWPKLQSLNKVANPLRLSPGTLILIPGNMAKPQPTTAEVVHVAGRATTRDAAPLRAGQRVAEGAQIDVADGGFVTLKLADGSIVRLPSGTSAQLRELRHAPATGNVHTQIEVQKGRVDATVTPLPSPRSRFEVRTPLAVGGVRGTTFGVAVAENGDFIGDVREGAVQVQRVQQRVVQPGGAASAATPGTALLRAGDGTRVTSSTDQAVTVSRLLPAPDLSRVPPVIEDISIVEFALPPTAGASAWQVRIASDESLQQVVRNATVGQPLARFAGLDDGSYQLAVRLLDERGIPGGESIRPLRVKARPQAPLLREPREGSRVILPDVELLCTEGSGVIGYTFQVARDASFDVLAAQSTSDATQCQFVARGLTPGPYWWRVASVARDAQGQRDPGPFSKPVAFTAIARPPVPATPSVQMDGGSSLAVQWGASTGGPWRYRIQLARDAGFTDVVDDRTLTEARYSRALPPAGTYYLRVRQLDADGLEGAWTDAQRIEVPGRIVTSDNTPVTNADGRHVSPGSR